MHRSQAGMVGTYDLPPTEGVIPKLAKPTDAEVWGLTLLAASEVPNFL